MLSGNVLSELKLYNFVIKSTTVYLAYKVYLLAGLLLFYTTYLNKGMDWQVKCVT